MAASGPLLLLSNCLTLSKVMIKMGSRFTGGIISELSFNACQLLLIVEDSSLFYLQLELSLVKLTLPHQESVGFHRQNMG